MARAKLLLVVFAVFAVVLPGLLAEQSMQENVDVLIDSVQHVGSSSKVVSTDGSS
jgi:hypothetical protein